MKMFKTIAAAVALLASAAIFAQTYPITNPTYVPNAIAPATTTSTTGTYVFNDLGIGTVNFQVSGTCTSLSATPQVSIDGTNWTAVQAYPAGVSGAPVTAIIATGLYKLPVAGYTKARLNISALAASCTFSAVGGPESIGSIPLPIGDPCAIPTVPKSFVAVNIGTATTTELVAAVAGKSVYMCGFNSTLAGTTPTAVFKSGTHVSADCDTGAVSLTGVFAPVTNASLSLVGSSTILQTAAAKELCVTTGGTGPSLQGVLTYVQQ